MSSPERSSIGQAVRWACILEVCAPKAGNVHPGASFADTTWRDFVHSANAIAPILNEAAARGVGQTILDSVKATKEAVGKNTNLGIILLLAPLCAVDRATPLREGIGPVLRNLTVRDAELTYEAIRLAKPGGLGDAQSQNVAEPPTQTLLEVMQLAAGRDDIARQYTCDFCDVFTTLPAFLSQHSPSISSQKIVLAHLAQLCVRPDTLIVRKCGLELAQAIQHRAHSLFTAPDFLLDGPAFQAFDAYLRADGNRRNPGTTADLVVAALFVCLREGKIAPPFPWVDRILETL
ncbi:MAG: triphosphoribosyl-dephospho-CoA synthase [Phycisphaeraceae bacterium]